MSREANNLQRHVEDCLVARREMRDWIVAAQNRSPYIEVTELDWIRYGNISPENWLLDKSLDQTDADWGYCQDDWDSWDDWDDWGHETYDAPELHEWDDWQYHEDESLLHDWEEYREPPDLEYGGCQYPREDVELARGLQLEST